MLRRSEQGAIQHRRACDLVGGLLQVPAEQLQRVLDAGCGQGFWTREVARSYPSIQVTGIDTNQKVIAQAWEAAEQEKIANVAFHTMDILQLADLAQFDLVFSRYVFLHLPHRSWLPAVQSLAQHVRPGGYLQLIDGGLERASTPAWQELMQIFTRLMHTMEQDAHVSLSFSSLLHLAGLDIHRCSYHPLLSGAWDKANFAPHQALARYMKARPFLEKAGISSPAHYDKLLSQAEREMEQPDFLAVGCVISVIGRQPESATRSTDTESGE